MKGKYAMKKTLAILIVFILSLSPVAALAENWYVETALSLIDHMRLLASDTFYYQAHTTSEFVRSNIISFAESDLSAPVDVYMISLPDLERGNMVIEQLGFGSYGDLSQYSDAAAAEMYARMPNAIVNLMIDQQYSATVRMAAGIVSTSRTYHAPEGFESCILLLRYPGKYSVAVSFGQSGEDTVAACSSFIYTSYLEKLLGI